jgi:hypothetical protein
MTSSAWRQSCVAGVKRHAEEVGQSDDVKLALAEDEQRVRLNAALRVADHGDDLVAVAEHVLPGEELRERWVWGQALEDLGEGRL